MLGDGEQGKRTDLQHLPRSEEVPDDIPNATASRFRKPGPLPVAGGGAVATLTLAVNPSVDAAVGRRANAQLEFVWLPLMRRWSFAPAKYAQQWSQLATSFVEVAAPHLDRVRGGPLRRAAGEFITDARADWRLLRSQVEGSDRWPGVDILLIDKPMLLPRGTELSMPIDFGPSK